MCLRQHLSHRPYQTAFPLDESRSCTSPLTKPGHVVCSRGGKSANVNRIARAFHA